MNEKDFKNGIEKLQYVRTTREEKERLLKNVLNTPIESTYVKSSPYFSRYHFRYARVAISLFLVISLSFGGVVYASDSSLPGDVLYPLKVNVVESILDKVNNSREEKIVWEEKKVERRIAEAERLEKDNKLDDVRSLELENRIERSSKAFADAVKEESDSEKVEKRKDEFRKKFEIKNEDEPSVNFVDTDSTNDKHQGSPKIDRLKRVAVESIDTEETEPGSDSKKGANKTDD